MNITRVAPTGTTDSDPTYEVEDHDVTYTVALIGPHQVPLCTTHGDRCVHVAAVKVLRASA